MANIRVKDLPNTNTAADTDEFIIDSSTAGTRRLSYSELKSEISTDFAADVATYGIATLDSDNKLTASQIPDSLAQGMNFVGVANSASDLTSTTQGDFYVIQTAFGSYNVGDQAVYDGSAYVRVVDGTKEISEGGTGATTLDAAKTNLEIINVGTGPSQVPLNQHLGSLAYQSSDGVSAAKLEVESTTGTATTQALTVTDGSSTKFVVQEDGKVGVGNSAPSDMYVTGNQLVVGDGADHRGMTILSATNKTGNIYFADGTGAGSYIGQIQYNHTSNALNIATNGATRATIDSSGRVGIGTASPGSYFSGTDDLVVAGTSGDHGVTIATPNTANGGLMFADSDSTTIGRIQYSHGTNEMKFRVNNTEVWSINSSGNLVANSTGIDFGSTNTTAGVTVTGSTLDHYEEGSWTVTTGGDATGVIGASSATYTRIGNIVTIRAVFTVTTNFTSNKIGGLPYQPAGNSVSSYTGATLAMTASPSSSPVSAYVLGSNNAVHFSSGTNLGSTHAPNTSNASYRVALSYNV